MAAATTNGLRERLRLLHCESGQGLVEYALIIAIVSLGALVALGFLSGKIQNLFSKAGNSVNNVTVAAGGSSGGGGPTPPTPGSVTITCPGACDDNDTLTGTTSGWTSGTAILGYTWTWEQNPTDNCGLGTGWGNTDNDGGPNDPDPTQTYSPDDATGSSDAVRVTVFATNAAGTSATSATACVSVAD